MKELEFKMIRDDYTLVIFDSNGPLGVVHNMYEFDDIRIQIAKHKYSDCYFIFKGVRHNICSNGRVENYPNNLYPMFEKQMVTLMCIEENS